MPPPACPARTGPFYNLDSLRKPGRFGITRKRTYTGDTCGQELNNNLPADIPGRAGHKNLAHVQVNPARCAVRPWLARSLASTRVPLEGQPVTRTCLPEFGIQRQHAIIVV